MLISIAIENFKSFDKLATFSMIASNKIRSGKERVFTTEDVSILKSAVIYGANASGKSNLIDAFHFMRHSILSPKGISLNAKTLFCKTREANKDRITTFEIRMCIKGVCYTYGFDILLKDRIIEAEWILKLTGAKEPIVLFQREKNKIEYGNLLNLSEDEQSKFKTYAEDLSENNSVLFLSEMNRNKKISKDSNFSFFKDIFNWFSDDINIFSPEMPVTNFEYYYDDTSLEVVKNIIRTFDTGITDINIKNITIEELRNKLPNDMFNQIIERIKDKLIDSNNENVDHIKLSMRSKDEFFNILVDDNEEPVITTLSFKHGKSFYEFEFDEESEGTRRIFDLLDILLSENKDSVYIIDEMERSLHPSLTRHFIELLNEYHVKNNIQLIFTTHEATIMTQELFRRDQIWFVSRDKDNNSNLYPLDAFNERYDKKISKAYLEGRYGAIPVFEEFNVEELK